jgi:hypothetical protein
MKTINKILLGMATVTTVLAPLVPKSLNVNINFESSPAAQSKEYRPINTQCDLTYKTITDSGEKICEYHCRDTNKLTVVKKFNSSTAICPATTSERIKEYVQ